MLIGVNLSQNRSKISLKSRFQVLPGNALEAALPQVREAEPLTRHSQPQAGNEAISKSLFYTGFHLKLTPMSNTVPLRVVYAKA